MNARLNHRRKAAGFILRMFQLQKQRPRGVDFILRLGMSESAQAREESGSVFDTEQRVLQNPSEALPSKKTQILTRNEIPNQPLQP